MIEIQQNVYYNIIKKCWKGTENMFYCRILEKNEIEEIYKKHMKKDFPRNELKPLSMIISSIDSGNYSCYGLFENEELFGYACFVALNKDGKNYCLLDYFAVLSDRRDKGIGSEFLRILREKFSNTEIFLCESEDIKNSIGEELNTRKRRISFYLRNNFIDTTVRANVFGVDYILLEFDLGKTHSVDEIRKSYIEIYSIILPKSKLEKNIHISKD